MRFELAGSLIHPDPLVMMLVTGVSFAPRDYTKLGYTNFDVICIGGGGGSGGGINTDNTGTLVRSTGGAGGGGGLHRVQGLLSALPDVCEVVVGSGGTFGIEHPSDPAQTTNGGDGGYSSFNDTTCQASGGSGGLRVQSNSTSIPTDANGGNGGSGGSKIAGDGSFGGIFNGTAGLDGDWDGVIGQGGGGGAGGVATYGSPPIVYITATAGGQGSYNLGDLSVYGPGHSSSTDAASGAPNVAPGGAGGAKAAPINGLTVCLHGSSASHHASGDPGFVVIRLTAV